MAKKPVLVVMAAGMGSRYGGLKQIDPVGSQGEAILEYVSQCTAQEKNASCYGVTPEEVEEAHSLGLSYGKYLVYEKIAQYTDLLSPEEANNMTMRQLRESWKEPIRNGLRMRNMQEKLVGNLKVTPAEVREYFKRQYPEADITHTVLDDGDLLLAIEKFVRDKQIDLIALTTYRRNILARILNPSIAKKMLFHTDTPLLVMHA